MKKSFLISLFALCLTLCGYKTAKATHVAGAVITYEFIGNNQYRVFLTAYRDCSGINITEQNFQMGFRNNCGVNGNFQVNRLPGTGEEIPTPCENTPTTCANPPGLRFGLQLVRYQGIFTVPAGQTDACQGWTFSWSLCCRNTSNTLVGQPNMYVESYVNHANWVQPRNNSPRFNIVNVPAYCIPGNVTIVLDKNENQGDSLTYSLVSAMQALNQDANYQPGRSPQAPVTIAAGSQITIDANGVISANVPSIQDGVFVIRLFELRRRPNGVIDTVGWTTLDVMVVLGTGRYCDNVTPTYSSRTLTRSCEDTTFVVTFNKDILCNSVERSGSELRLFDSLTRTTIPIKLVEPLSCRPTSNGNVTNRIQVTLEQQLYKNGRYFLVSRIGIDGDTYGNICDKYMDPFDTLRINVNNCYEYDEPMVMLNVSVDSMTNEGFIAQWDEPQNFDFFYFKHYRIFRTLDYVNPPYQHFALEPDSKIFKHLDSQPEELPSVRPSRYAVDLELKNSLKTKPSNVIKSITSREPEPKSGIDDETMKFTWNHYDGWNNPRYVVQIGADVDGVRVWTELTTTSDSIVEIKKPLDPNKYYLRVYTKQPTSNLISYSNWISFEVPERFVSIPNVFTPNGDGVNDLFEIENIRFYPGSKLIIHDRWGRKVFSSDNYQNEWGGDINPGTYFYVFTQSTGQIIQGSIKVITN